MARNHISYFERMEKMKYFNVTFQHSEFVYCSNIAHAETAEAVREHYSKYPFVAVSPADPRDLEAAARCGMPIVEIQ